MNQVDGREILQNVGTVNLFSIQKKQMSTINYWPYCQIHCTLSKSKSKSQKHKIKNKTCSPYINILVFAYSFSFFNCQDDIFHVKNQTKSQVKQMVEDNTYIYTIFNNQQSSLKLEWKKENTFKNDTKKYIQKKNLETKKNIYFCTI